MATEEQDKKTSSEEQIDWKTELVRKLMRTKMWVAVAAGLGSISAGIAALNHPNEVVAGIGIGCGILSGAILAAVYVITEGSIDRESVKADTKTTTVTSTVTASTTDKTTALKLTDKEA